MKPRTHISTVFLLAVVIGLAGCGSPDTVVDEGYGEFLLVPSGEFLMGDNFDEGHSDEIPVHAVDLDGFYIARHKTTNAAYKRFMDAGGYRTAGYWQAGGFGECGEAPDFWSDADRRGGGIAGNGQYPVVGVSWFEAAAYCSWLSAETGALYRLPTEAEFEKAARGLGQTRYPWGNEIDPSYASFDSGEPRDSLRLTPVGYFNGEVRGGLRTNDNASPFGAYDMAGNTSEWCSDWYGRDYYSRSPASNPKGPDSGVSRVLRSAGYIDSGYYQRSASRHKRGAHLKGHSTGFRCVREIGEGGGR
ncbi:MAG: formylglycine-generating enzyme family protein [Thermoanaerobaculales bacterium]|nr:formylglycine-generating enzyme family protein [Thermoanaerobaculales bacterium]